MTEAAASLHGSNVHCPALHEPVQHMLGASLYSMHAGLILYGRVESTM